MLIDFKGLSGSVASITSKNETITGLNELNSLIRKKNQKLLALHILSDFSGIRNLSSLNDLNSLNNLSGLIDVNSLQGCN